MTNPTRFSLRRFGQVLRLNTAEGYNSALRHYGAAYLFFFIVLTFVKFSISYGEVYGDFSEKDLEIVALAIAQGWGRFGFFATLFLLLVSIGSCFSSGRSSLSGRMRQLMLPASTLEKFCAVIFTHTLIAAVCFVLLFIAADASTVLLGEMLDVEVAWSTPVYLSTLIYPQFGDVVMPPMSPAMALLLRLLPTIFFIGLWSTYLLGALVFRSKSFVRTSVVMILGFTIVALLFVLGAYTMRENFSFSFNDQESEYLFSTALVLFWLLTLAWSIFSITYSYRLYARSEVIPHSRFGF
mgnify:FL=1|jgi:membrane protein